MTDERLLRQIRQDARAFQEEVEASVAELAASDRTLRDVLIDYGKQGLELRLESAGRYLVGRIEHVGAGIVRLASNEGRKVDVATRSISGIRQMAGDDLPGSVTTGHPGSIIARLREAVQTEEVVHLDRNSGESLEGQVTAVLDSAIEIKTVTATWLIPIDAIIWIWRA